MGKYDQNLEVEVKVQDTKSGDSKLLTFFGIKQKSDVDDILGRIMSGTGFMAKPNPDKHIDKAWAKGNILYIVIKKSEIPAFMGSGMKSVITALVRSGNYDVDKIMHLQDVVDFQLNQMGDAEKEQLFKDSAMSVADLWTMYLNKVNDPETMKILKLYSKIYGNSIYGHALSLKNVMTIRAMGAKYGTNPTFVLGRSTWIKYGRDVKSGAKPYPLWRYVNKDSNASKSTIDATRQTVQNDLGQGDVDYSDLGVTVQNKIDIEVNKILSKGNLMPIKYLGYDISDTYLINPADNPLDKKPNIKGNVVYELNALAQQLEDEKNASKNGEFDQDEQTRMNNRTEVAASAVEELCQEKNITVTGDINTADNRLLNSLLSYYRTLVTPKANVLKPENIEQYARDAVQLTLIMTDTGLNLLNRFQHSLVYTQKEAVALAPIIRMAVSKIGSKVSQLQEGIMDNDFMTSYKNALKKLGIKVVRDNNPEINVNQESNGVVENVINKEQITENFNKYLERLNNPLKGEYYE